MCVCVCVGGGGGSIGGTTGFTSVLVPILKPENGRIPHCSITAPQISHLTLTVRLFGNPNLLIEGGKVETSDRVSKLLALIRRKKVKGEALTPMQLSAARNAIGDENSPEDLLVEALERLVASRDPPAVMPTRLSPHSAIGNNCRVIVAQSGGGSKRTDKVRQNKKRRKNMAKRDGKISPSVSKVGSSSAYNILFTPHVSVMIRHILFI